MSSLLSPNFSSPPLPFPFLFFPSLLVYSLPFHILPFTVLPNPVPSPSPFPVFYFSVRPCPLLPCLSLSYPIIICPLLPFILSFPPLPIPFPTLSPLSPSLIPTLWVRALITHLMNQPPLSAVIPRPYLLCRELLITSSQQWTLIYIPTDPLHRGP